MPQRQYHKSGRIFVSTADVAPFLQRGFSTIWHISTVRLLGDLVMRTREGTTGIKTNRKELTAALICENNYSSQEFAVAVESLRARRREVSDVNRQPVTIDLPEPVIAKMAYLTDRTAEHIPSITQAELSGSIIEFARNNEPRALSETIQWYRNAVIGDIFMNHPDGTLADQAI